jgi:iron complex transport system permease protein
MALGLTLAALAALLGFAGLIAGTDGWHLSTFTDPGLHLVLWDIRAPRTLGAWLTGALLGLSGAVAQGLFRNPLADPYLLGSSAGAGLGVVLVLAGSTMAAHGMRPMATDFFSGLGLVGAAFAGALLGVMLTLVLAKGTQRTTALLLAGVVVGVVLGAVADLVTMIAPDALRGKQVFMLGTTGFLGWSSCAVLATGVLLTAPPAWRFSRALDALTLGEDSARSLGLPLRQVRLLLIGAMALSTGTAVAQSGMVAFVGLVAPHLVRRRVQATHGYTLLASAAMGGALLLASDILARTVVAPEELPVGVLTAVLGGGYLLWLLHRREDR